MAEIQWKVIKQGKRNPVSRIVHARNDKDKIAAWRLDFIRILQVFNVCSIVSGRMSLTVRLKTELSINTHVAVSDTRTMVSDIHRTVVKGQEGNDSKNLSVGHTWPASTPVTR